MDRPATVLPQGLMLASGMAGLGFQIVWTQQCAMWLGHEAASVMAVVAAFFGGLTLGAWWLAARIQRSARPGLWYAACEAVIGLWGLFLSAMLPAAGAWLQAQLGPTVSTGTLWSAIFAGCLVLLLPATVAMGATLPAMQRLAALQASTRGRTWAGLYAANTAGAVAGVLVAALLLVPMLGLARTAMVCAAVNLLTAGVAWRRLGGVSAVDPPSGAEAGRMPEVAGRGAAAGQGRSVWTQLFVTGLLGIGYELLVVRVLSQVTEDTVYTFALLLAVYLAGTALGAVAYRRWMARGQLPAAEAVTTRLTGALAAACLLGSLGLWGAERLRDAVDALLSGVDHGMGPALGAEAVLAVVAFAPATAVMGALFSHLCRLAIAGGADGGRCLAINTLGGALASPIVGVVLLPAMGAKLCLLLLAAGYALLGGRVLSSPWCWGPLAGAAVLASVAPPLVFVSQPDGGRLVAYREGVSAAVSVVEDGQGVARLYINNRQQEGSSATWRVDGRQALLPLLLHPAPRQALFLGVGTGVTAATATLDPALEVQAVELLPEVVTLSRHFTEPLVDAGVALQRLHLQVADARRFVRTVPRRYDLIVADNFHPARSGSGALYTVEHFQAVRARLAEGGVFCQWLPLHQLDLATLASIVASFQTVFPQARAVLASNSLATPVLGLVGGVVPLRWQPGALQGRLAALPQVAAFGFEDPMAVLGSFVAGPMSLRRWSEGAPLNTDDQPVVAYQAPRVTYAPGQPPVDRLMQLLSRWRPEPDTLLAPRSEATWGPRVAAYAQARQRFIAAGRGVQAQADPQAMLAQVREPLLAVLRDCPEFRPAYDPLWRLAAAVGSRDPSTAQSLLTELIRLQPDRPEASTLLARWTAPP